MAAEPKAVRLLADLCAGNDVRLPNGFTIRHVDGNVVFVAERWTDDGDEEAFLPCDMTLNEFLRMAAEMPDEDPTTLAAIEALNERYRELLGGR